MEITLDEIGIMIKASLNIVPQNAVSSFGWHSEDSRMSNCKKKSSGAGKSSLEKPDMEAWNRQKSIGAQFSRRLQKLYSVPGELEHDGISSLLTKLSEKLDRKP